MELGVVVSVCQDLAPRRLDLRAKFPSLRTTSDT